MADADNASATVSNIFTMPVDDGPHLVPYVEMLCGGENIDPKPPGRACNPAVYPWLLRMEYDLIESGVLTKETVAKAAAAAGATVDEERDAAIRKHFGVIDPEYAAWALRYSEWHAKRKAAETLEETEKRVRYLRYARQNKFATLAKHCSGIGWANSMATNACEERVREARSLVGNPDYLVISLDPDYAMILKVGDCDMGFCDPSRGELVRSEMTDRQREIRKEEYGVEWGMRFEKRDLSKTDTGPVAQFDPPAPSAYTVRLWHAVFEKLTHIRCVSLLNCGSVECLCGCHRVEVTGRFAAMQSTYEFDFAEAGTMIYVHQLLANPSFHHCVVPKGQVARV